METRCGPLSSEAAERAAQRGGERREEMEGGDGRSTCDRGTHRERTGWEGEPARQALMEMKHPPGSTRKTLHQPEAWSSLRIYIVF